MGTKNKISFVVLIGLLFIAGWSLWRLHFWNVPLNFLPEYETTLSTTKKGPASSSKPNLATNITNSLKIINRNASPEMPHPRIELPATNETERIQSLQKEARKRLLQEKNHNGLLPSCDSPLPKKVALTSCSEKLNPILTRRRGHSPMNMSPSSYPRYNEDGQVLVRFQYNPEAVSKERIENMISEDGGSVYAHIPEEGVLDAYLPQEKLYDWSTYGWVKHIDPVGPAVSRAGSIITEADDLLDVQLARRQFDVDGSGIKIGVISGGVDHLAEAQASGDLPSNVHVIANGWPESNDEGTAMLEIIHDLAPGATLYFHDGGSETRFRMAVNAFRGYGCHVIVDDVGYYSEPFFQDGQVAQTVADAVSGGVVFVSAAGNDANRHAEMYWSPTHSDPNDANFNELLFGVPALVFPNDEEMIVFMLGPDHAVQAVLQWSERFGQAAHDYDIIVYDYDDYYDYLTDLNIWLDWHAYGFLNWIKYGYWYDSFGNLHFGPPADPVRPSALYYSRDIQNGSGDPLENTQINNDSRYWNTYIMVVEGWSSASTSDRLEMLFHDWGYSGAVNIPGGEGTPVGSIYGHPAVPGVLAVGAINVNDVGLDDIEPFSSQGPSYVPFSSTPWRSKPDLCAVDGVSVTGAGEFSSPFFGTSAAAPHVAAMAALLKDYNTSLSVVEICALLQDTADDLGSAGHDSIFGYGRANIQLALENAPPFADDNMVTSNLWIRAIINTVEKGQIEGVWQKGGEDTTDRGDRAIWGHFYVSPSDVTWGSPDNPDLFVKIWFDVSGRIDVNFFHVSVPDIEVYSDYPFDGIPDEQSTTTISRRYIRHYYESGQSHIDENYEDGIAAAGYLPVGNPLGYATVNDLRIGAVIDTEEKGPVDAVWRLGGQDTTARGDQVVWGHFYASPSDVIWGSQDNPDLFVKIWFDVSGRVDVNFFHVSVPDIEVYSDLPSDANYDQRGTTIMADRYIRHEY